jgi:hypothetical protein
MATTIKIKRSSSTGSLPSTSDLELGELAINTYDGKLFFKKDIGGTESIETIVGGITPYNDDDVEDYLNGHVAVDIIPAENESVSLGSPTKRFTDLYLSGNTINIGGATISSDGSGSITISATGATLPVGSKIDIGANTQKNIATVGENGVTSLAVNLFTQVSGLSSSATTFSFKTNPSSKVFTNFTLADGTDIIDSEITQFFF